MLLTTRLADEYWLLAHDDVAGQSRLSERIEGLGLAGALLGELALLGRIDVTAGGVLWVTDPRTPDDPLQHVLLDQVLHEERLPVSDWLRVPIMCVNCDDRRSWR